MTALIIIFAIVIIGLIFDLEITKSIDNGVTKMAIACFVVLECVIVYLRFIEPISTAISWLKFMAFAIYSSLTPELIFFIITGLITASLIVMVYFKHRRERREFLGALTKGRKVTVCIFTAMGVGKIEAKIISVNKKLKVINTDKGHFWFRNIVL